MIRELRLKILELLYKYEFQEEIRGNKGFKNDIFQQKMEAVGWDYGQAWCTYLQELIWKEAYGHFDSSVINILDKLFSANAVKTFENFMESDLFDVVTDRNAEPGDLAIWAYYNDGKPRKNGIWTLGHMGGVTMPTYNILKTIDGNTNSKGGREGFEAAEKERKYTFNANNGLRLLGFVKPMEV